MDPIYSNKKYLQTLNAADYYSCRNPTMRPMGNEYACGSYQNTMSRRSLFGVYAHQPNMSKYSYPSDVSLSSHYNGYTSWGLWREPGHLSPSIYSKRRINIRSFSILIMSAAFIVLLAVLSIAALAFYFSTFKSDPIDSTLVFDCNFRVVRGDVYTSGLKYNHTAIYRQKAAFYTKFIETSLEHGNFNVAKTDIYGFGNGPEIQPSFRVFLDMRKIQITITNVEEHIKNAFVSETLLAESSFRNLKIDEASIEIKRQLDPEVLQQASLFYGRDQYHQQEGSASAPATTLNSFPTTVIPLDDLTISTTSSKKHQQPSSTERGVKSKTSTTTSTTSKHQGSNNSSSGKRKDNQKPIHESDVDMENLPVITGSFEITKTDADIAQKRNSNVNQKRPASTTSTLKPFFISPVSSIRIKAANEKPSVAAGGASSSSKQPTTMPTTTKLTTLRNVHLHEFLQKMRDNVGIAKIEKTNKNGDTSITDEFFNENFSETPPPPPPPPTPPMLETYNDENDDELPKLDVSLFTSAPILDHQPWRPIQPSQIQLNFPNQVAAATTTDTAAVTTSGDRKPVEQSTGATATTTAPTIPHDVFRSPFKPNPPENVLFRNKFVDPVNDTNDSVFYQSFYNPNFSAGDLEIEKLGIADVRPYPLPVNKIDLNEYHSHSSASALNTTTTSTDNGKVNASGSNMKVNYDNGKLNHSGGGVVAKKPDTSVEQASKVVDKAPESAINDRNNSHSNEQQQHDSEKLKNVTESTANLSDIFQELLDLEEADDALNLTMSDNNKLESRIISDDDDSIESDDIQSPTELPSSSTIDSPASTEKLSFMNMKEFIVQMQRNKSSGEEEDDDEEEVSDVVEEGRVTNVNGADDGRGKTTEKSTTIYVEVETLKYTPSTAAPIIQSTVTVPQLFPDIVHKWEFVNGTAATNSSESSITRKVFNETLQAVVVENSQTTPTPSSQLLDLNTELLKSNRSMTAAAVDEKQPNLQELSSIFDTLVSKLGVRPVDTVSKTPPFSQNNSKLKNGGGGSRNRTATTPSMTRKTNSKSTQATPISKQRPTNKSTPLPPLTTTRLPQQRKSSSTSTTTTAPSTFGVEKLFTSPGTSSEVVLGEAEVEAVDPTQYDEMLSLATVSRFSTTTPSLITLLPAKSNSGIRHFSPRLKLAARTASRTSAESVELPKNFVVKTSMTFDS